MTLLNYKSFAPLVHNRFTVKLEEGTEVPFTLEKVMEKNNEHCEQFSLIFNGPADRCLPQKTYSMKHDTLGEHLIFFVPVGEIAEDEGEGRKIVGYQYQAIFNRLKEPQHASQT